MKTPTTLGNAEHFRPPTNKFLATVGRNTLHHKVEDMEVCPLTHWMNIFYCLNCSHVSPEEGVGQKTFGVSSERACSIRHKLIFNNSKLLKHTCNQFLYFVFYEGVLVFTHLCYCSLKMWNYRDISEDNSYFLSH